MMTNSPSKGQTHNGADGKNERYASDSCQGLKNHWNGPPMVIATATQTITTPARNHHGKVTLMLSSRPMVSANAVQTTITAIMQSATNADQTATSARL
jgi:hypothetical protein